MGNTNLVPYETIVRATSGEPEAVDEVLRHYSKRIRFMCFDIRDLGNQLKEIGMLIVQDAVWNRVSQNRERKVATRYYCDEFHLLLKEKQTAIYSVEIWKRFRKWGGIPTGLTQNVGDFLKSEEIEGILGNSDFVYLLNQNAKDQHILADKLGLSEKQLMHVTNSEPGSGLILFDNVVTKPSSATAQVTEHTKTDSEGNTVSENSLAEQKKQAMAEAAASEKKEESGEKEKSETGKEFYTIQTASEKVFYLIIDRDGEEEMVYFLTEVTENDLLNVTADNSDTLPKNSAALESAIPVTEGALPNNNGWTIVK